MREWYQLPIYKFRSIHLHKCKSDKINSHPEICSSLEIIMRGSERIWNHLERIWGSLHARKCSLNENCPETICRKINSLTVLNEPNNIALQGSLFSIAQMTPLVSPASASSMWSPHLCNLTPDPPIIRKQEYGPRAGLGRLGAGWPFTFISYQYWEEEECLAIFSHPINRLTWFG